MRKQASFNIIVTAYKTRMNGTTFNIRRATYGPFKSKLVASDFLKSKGWQKDDDCDNSITYHHPQLTKNVSAIIVLYSFGISTPGFLPSSKCLGVFEDFRKNKKEKVNG